MLSLDYRIERAQSVALVACVITNEHTTPVTVRVRNQLDGTVHPPRRCGHPVAGWNDCGYDGTVPAGERLAIGYACSKSETEGSSASDTVSPISVEATPVHTVSEEPSLVENERTPVDELVALGDPRPPTMAIPRRPFRRVPATEPVESMRDAVERRLESCERVATATSVPALSRILNELGGLDELDRMIAALEHDHGRLRQEDKTERELSVRIERVLDDVPREAVAVFA